MNLKDEKERQEIIKILDSVCHFRQFISHREIIEQELAKEETQPQVINLKKHKAGEIMQGEGSDAFYRRILPISTGYFGAGQPNIINGTQFIIGRMHIDNFIGYDGANIENAEDNEQIDQDIIVTLGAAHYLALPDGDERSKTLINIEGNLHCAHVVTFYDDYQWEDEETIQKNDMALCFIKTARDLYAHIPLGMANLCVPRTRGRASVTGYDEPSLCPESKRRLLTQKGKFKVVGDFLRYRIGASQGQGGGPITVTERGVTKIIGVHIDTDPMTKKNVGIAFTDEIIEWIEGETDEYLSWRI